MGETAYGVADRCCIIIRFVDVKLYTDSPRMPPALYTEYINK